MTCAAAALGADVSFERHQVDPQFWSEGVAIADVNRDGKTDVFAGDVWYETAEIGKWKRHELRAPRGVYDGNTGYSNSFANFAADVNQDGWADVIIVGFPGAPYHWYENPKGQSGHWKEHHIWRSACNETPLYVDLLGDGKPGVVLAYQPEGQMGYFRPGKAPIRPWEPLAISEPKSPGTVQYWHGLGVGDINGDGKNDVIIHDGWWEQPKTLTQAAWKFHAVAFHPPKRMPPDPVRENPACADMYAYDVDGDGDNDVLASSAHAYGVWWYEQVPGNGEPKFVPHVIRDDVSQSHAMHLVDMNGDGVKDLVTGKRYFAHQGKDPGAFEPAYLYWVEIRRENRKPKFTFHQIDDNSGHGTQFVVADFNGDKLPDVVTSNKKGTHVFLQKRSQ